MRSGPFAADERAVSNTLGYILLFGIVLASITAVGTLGVQALEETRQGTLQENAEYTMTSVASAVGDVHAENVPRTSRVRLATGSLRLGAETEITVNPENNGTNYYTVTTRPLIYTSDDVQIVYVAGAVFRIQEQGEVVVREPEYSAGSGDLVFPIVATQTDTPGRIVSGSNAQVVLYRDSGSQSLFHKTGYSQDVNISIDPADSASLETRQRRAELWRSAIGTGSCSIAGSDSDRTDCVFATGDSVVVRSTVTQVELHT